MNILYSILLTVCTGGMGLLGIYSAVYALANRRYAGRFLRWLLYSVPVVIGASVLGSWFAHFNQDTGLSLGLLVLPFVWLVIVLGAQQLLGRPVQAEDEMLVILPPSDRED
ncbi:MAG: hypothetical protein KME04_16305 [Pleurocapsa minor GSE-CHR-MK-17-07R]|jgi:amino acid transporter|nr:hypothetical protein [Pleurocapsa minor GSE-CHR-MK 17-07R]